MEGTVTHGAARGRFELTWARPHDRESARRYEGTYRTSDGRTLRVSASPRIARLLDASDGRMHRLVAIDADRFAVGPTLGGTFPWTGTIEFAVTGAPRAERLTWREGDGRAVEARRVEYREEELNFKSGDTTLSGALLLPAGRGPFPAVVGVHGSGRETRDNGWDQSIARVFLDEGVAVFLYDKRGVAASGGDYVPGAREGDNTSPANVERLAADARAAAATIAARPDVVRGKVGLFGISQAGWIIPLAAARSPDVRFVLVASGPTVPTSLEAIHSDLLADGARQTAYTLEQADEWVRKAPRVGFDPAPAIRDLEIPGLWLYGALDSSIPVPECLRTLERIRAERRHDFEVVTVPRAGHSLYEVARDIEDEIDVSPGFAPTVIQTIRTWLRAHGIGAAPVATN
jgi:dienelactone hydrolase